MFACVNVWFQLRCPAPCRCDVLCSWPWLDNVTWLHQHVFMASAFKNQPAFFPNDPQPQVSEARTAAHEEKTAQATQRSLAVFLFACALKCVTNP